MCILFVFYLVVSIMPFIFFCHDQIPMFLALHLSWSLERRFLLINYLLKIMYMYITPKTIIVHIHMKLSGHAFTICLHNIYILLL